MTHYTPTHKPAFSSRIAPPLMESGGNYTHSILLKSAAAVLLLLAAALFCGAAAAVTSDGGTSGGIDWSISDDGTLTISPADSPESGYSKGQMKEKYRND